MFTGIIECTGRIAALTPRGAGLGLTVAVPESMDLAHRVAIGDSIAVNGVCLTATSFNALAFTADVSPETVRCSAFRDYRPGTVVNLELACTPTTHLGGHIVQGHVDGLGEVVQRVPNSEAVDVWIKVPPDLIRYLAPKGSVAVDGVSLTINEMQGERMRLTLIPHTMGRVNYNDWQVGVRVNLEADVIARYLEQLISGTGRPAGATGALTLETLYRNGF